MRNLGIEPGTIDFDKLRERPLESETMNPEPDFRVELVDDEIIVILTGSYNSMTYFKPDQCPNCSLSVSQTKSIRAFR